MVDCKAAVAAHNSDMADENWRVIRSETVYNGEPWLRVHRHDVRLPDGSIINGHHAIEMIRPAVGVVPVDDDQRVLMVEHERFITGTIGWEIPAGGIDVGEETIVAAARELLEETGYRASTLQPLGHYHPSNGISNQVFHICVARGLSRAGEVQDKNEVRRIAWWTAEQVKSLIADNQILDGLSLTSLLWFLFNRREELDKAPASRPSLQAL